MRMFVKASLKLRGEFPYFWIPKTRRRYEWNNSVTASKACCTGQAVLSPDRKKLKELVTEKSITLPGNPRRKPKPAPSGKKYPDSKKEDINDPKTNTRNPQSRVAAAALRKKRIPGP